MNSEDKNISLQFYDYLCNIVGSEEVVRTRREIFSGIEIVQKASSGTFISSGSKAEGLDLKGSDFDQIIYPNFIRVYEILNCVQSDPDKVPLVMETNDTKSGFTKLKLAIEFDYEFDMIQDWFETVGEEKYISSKRFREKDLPDDMVIHGLCQSTAGGDYDHAQCLWCKEWISSAQQWIHRSRTVWPDNTLVMSAVQYGVLFVPIGYKNSPNEDLEWRISFSVAEKLLVHSFSHTQLLCYALMKIILTDIIKPRHSDLLCSYFLKIIMFWLSEEINPSGWKPENMISCFLDCIRRLVYCVEYKTCLHYFISENNLFEDRFTDKDHKALLDTLRYVYGSPWTSVFHTDTFLNYKLQSINSHWMARSASELSCFSYIRMICNNRSMYSQLKSFGIGYNNIFRKDICAYMLSVCSIKSMQSSDFYNLADKNKSFYKQYKRLFGHINIRLQSDSITPWLLLSSLFYKCKRFRECLNMINYCLFTCTPDRINVDFAYSLAEQTVFKQMKKTLGLMHACKYLILENVFIDK
ncbi:protein mab-21-like [Mytilus edulis]|uniref:protein mab-21-like n=1 Tax=Mytilus edulis TaxID=6550 RepID=UPI0039F03150